MMYFYFEKWINKEGYSYHTVVGNSRPLYIMLEFRLNIQVH